MSVVGADTEQLRATATQLTQAADRLQGTLQHLNSSVTNTMYWRGPDSERFRSEWNGRFVHVLRTAIDSLRSGAETLRRNADEQVNASRAEGGGSDGAGGSTKGSPVHSPQNTHDMYGEIREMGEQKTNDSSGYRVQRVVGPDGETRYIVYIVGVDGSSTQTGASSIDAAQDKLDSKQIAALERLIPKDSDVMLAGLSQGGMDAQNIAKSGRLHVTQIVTFGSPSRADLDVPAVHMRADWDPVPHSTSGVLALGTGAGALLGGPGGALRGAMVTATPYAGSSLELGGNNEFFKAGSNVQSLNPMDHHGMGYDNVSKEYDKAVADGSAGKMNKHTGDFKGEVSGVVDIKADGSGSW